MEDDRQMIAIVSGLLLLYMQAQLYVSRLNS